MRIRHLLRTPSAVERDSRCGRKREEEQVQPGRRTCTLPVANNPTGFLLPCVAENARSRFSTRSWHGAGLNTWKRSGGCVVLSSCSPIAPTRLRLVPWLQVQTAEDVTRAHVSSTFLRQDDDSIASQKIHGNTRYQPPPAASALPLSLTEAKDPRPSGSDSTEYC